MPLVCLEGSAVTLQAALRYLMFALLGSALYLLGVGLLYGAYGTLDIVLLARRIGVGQGTVPAVFVAAALMTAGLLAKTALFPLHLWLPPAHANAPAPASAILSALVVKGSFFLIVRLWFDVMPGLATNAAMATLGALGSGAILFGSVLALRQSRLKLLIAYSTIAQIGYLFLMFPLAVGSQPWQADAWNGGVMQVLSHALAKAAMFLAAGLVAEALGHDRISGLGGIGRAMPMTMLAFGLGGLSLMGLPPSGGFLAKWLLLQASIKTGQWHWAIVLLIGGLLAGAYIYRVVAPALGPVVLTLKTRVSRGREAIALALALGAVVLGFAPPRFFCTVANRSSGNMSIGVTHGSFILAAAVAMPLAVLVLCLSRAITPVLPILLVVAPLPGLAAALLVLSGQPLALDLPSLRLSLQLDVPAAMLLGASSLLWSAAGAFAVAFLRGAQSRDRFIVCWLLTMTGSMGVFMAADLFGFYLFFALVSLPAYGLISHDDDAKALRAGAVYISFAVVSEALLLMGFVLLAAGEPGGSVQIRDVMAALPHSPLRCSAIAFTSAGFVFKLGLVPAHSWMPLAYGAAPTPAAAVLSGAAVKAGVIGLIRFLPFDDHATSEILVAVGLFSAFYGVAVGLTQSNPKTVLAYSSISQMGVITTLIGMGMSAADPGTRVDVAFYASNHVLGKGALFLAIGVVAGMSSDRIKPTLALAAVLALGLGGLPLTGGSLAKFIAKTSLGQGPIGTLALASTVGTNLLMMHFLSTLIRTAKRQAGLPSIAGYVWPWRIAATAGIGLAWVLFGATGEHVSATLTVPAVIASSWPVVAGVVLWFVFMRRNDRLPHIPPGDILYFL